jgi:protein-tyrosine phosphatase
MIDLHCHILPGLDDGARDLAHAVAMARIAQDDGITHIVGTPHLFKGSFDFPDLGLFDEARERLAGALREEGIAVTILTGAEVHITHGLVDEVRARRKSLTLAGSAYLIVEFPHDHVFSGAKDLFFELMSEGVVPIIAHPERNASFARSPRLLFDLVVLGALVQVNAGSLLAGHGPEAAEAARRFLELGLVHFIASDGHNTQSKAPRLAAAAEKAAALVGEENASALVTANPRAVIEDREIPFRPDPVDPERKERKLKIRIPGFLRPGK